MLLVIPKLYSIALGDEVKGDTSPFNEMGNEILLRELMVKYSNDADGKRCFHILDLGKTQVPVGSLTALAFQVTPKGTIPELVNLKPL